MEMMKKLLCWILSLSMVFCMAGIGVAEDDMYVGTSTEITEPVTDDMEEPIEEPSEEPAEEPSEEPAEEPSEEPSEEPAEEPSEEPSEEPAEEPSEEPAEEPSEEPSEEPAEEPSEEPAEEPSEEPAEEPSEEPSEEPAEEPSEEPAEEPVEEPVEDVVVTKTVALQTAELVNIAILDAQASYTVEGALSLVLVAAEGYELPASVSVSVDGQGYSVTGYTTEEIEAKKANEEIDENTLVYNKETGRLTIPFSVLGEQLSVAAVALMVEVREEVTSNIVITKQPEDSYAEVDEQAEFTVEASGVVSYQWQYSKNGTSWTNTSMNGYKTARLYFKVTATRRAQLYRCVLTDENGNKVYTTTAGFQDAPAVEEPEEPQIKIVITKQPEDACVAVDAQAEFTVEASGVVTYQWQVSTNGGKSWMNTSHNGNKTDRLYFKATAARRTHLFRCVLTDEDGNKVYTEAAGIQDPIAVEIVKQPESVSVEVGETVVFTVEASGAVGYQWEKSADGAAWVAMECTESVLSLVATAENSAYQYRCVVTGGAGDTVTTNVVTITLPEPKIVITKQPEDSYAAVDAQAEFTVEASGVVTYQWQYSKNGTSWTNTSMNGYKTARLYFKVTEARRTQLYRCVLTDEDGNKYYTEPAGFRDPIFAEITTQPVSVEAEMNETVVFTVEATNAATYQWEMSTDGEAWTPADSTENTLTIVVAAENYAYQYRCVVTSSTGHSVTSDPVQIIKPESDEIVLDDVTYLKIGENTLRVVSYAGTAASVVIPEQVEGMTVVEIGEEAFMGNTTLTSIDLPDTITKIGKRAFKNCTNLSEMH